MIDEHGIIINTAIIIPINSIKVRDYLTFIYFHAQFFLGNIFDYIIQDLIQIRQCITKRINVDHNRRLQFYHSDCNPLANNLQNMPTLDSFLA